MVLIEFTMASVLLAPLLITGGMTAQAQITTVPVPGNNTKLIFDMKKHTQTLVNATSNETISVENFTVYRPNMTTNESLTAGTENMTTNESLTAGTENMTTNETLPGSVGNMSSNINLTEKFKELG
jgi:hypothetical protein